MALWNLTDANTSSPGYVAKQVGVAANSVNQNVLFGNNTVSAFPNDGLASVGLFGVSPAEVGNASSAGWVLVTQGTGPVSSLSIGVGGTGYQNNDVGTISGGTTNAAFTLSTNSTGGITTLTLGNAGAGFINDANTVVAVANSTGGASAGSNATFTTVLGGRANRKHYETIVATRAITGSGSTLP
jgi:hypothetical protein